MILGRTVSPLNRPPHRRIPAKCVRGLGTYVARSPFLELVREVNGFPSREHDLEAYRKFTKPYYRFKINGYSQSFGLIHERIVDRFHWPSYWNYERSNRTLTLSTSTNVEQKSSRFSETLNLIAQSDDVPSLKTLRGEIIPVYSPDGEPVMHIDRAGSILFGTVMYGIQLLAWTRTQHGLRYWVPRRSKTVRAYAGMLDHCAGGALNSGETPMETLLREANEEASLPKEYVREHARSFGVVSYHMAQNANNEEGHQPQVMYTYSIELPPDLTPKPSDGEVESFELMSLDDVKTALFRREFKANCVLTWISFLISQGIINAENERNLQELTTHLHRRLDFPAP